MTNECGWPGYCCPGVLGTATEAHRLRPAPCSLLPAPCRPGARSQRGRCRLGRGRPRRVPFSAITAREGPAPLPERPLPGVARTAPKGEGEPDGELLSLPGWCLICSDLYIVIFCYSFSHVFAWEPLVSQNDNEE